MKYSQRVVRIGHKLAPSGRLLYNRLLEEDYSGPPINWGHTKYPGLNAPEAIKLSSNKKRALFTMRDAGVPTPALYESIEDIVYPVIGRTSYHTRGSGLWYCEDEYDAERAKEEGATHFLQFVEKPREFRVHIVGGKSIKLSEKHKYYDPEDGFIEEPWTYPAKFMRKKSLRSIASDAVEALGLDFGAVDILYKKIDDEPCFFVLEVNTAPCLTESIDNSTLERWVDGFMDLAMSKADQMTI